MANVVVLEIQDDHTPVDLLVWNYFHREYPDIVDQVWALNPGLAALGTFPPPGTKVTVPLPTARKAAKAPKPLVTLWTKAS